VTDQAERDRLMTLAKEGKQQGWWQSYDLPYSNYVGWKPRRLPLAAFIPRLFPALLQTADYARAIHEAAIPEISTPALTSVVVDQRVEARIRRQDLLTKGKPLISQ